jgi:HSP20 family molecular chaperone IbpA
MAQQLVTAMQRSNRDFDELFVSSDRFDEHLRRVGDMIARRAFEIFERRGHIHGHDWEDWYRAEASVLQTVNNEVSDSGDAFLAVVAIGAQHPQDLKLSAEPLRLRIVGCLIPATNGSATPKKITTRPRAFSLAYQFPDPVDPATASAEIRGDLLEVRLPKATPSRNASD